MFKTTPDKLDMHVDLLALSSRDVFGKCQVSHIKSGLLLLTCKLKVCVGFGVWCLDLAGLHLDNDDDLLNEDWIIYRMVRSRLDIARHVIYDVSHNIAKVEKHMVRSPFECGHRRMV
jgi:hypothetical protein